MAKRQSSLVDPVTGKPLEWDVLDREIAAPTLSGVRSILSGHPAQGLDPVRLASILRAAEQGDADAYFDLAEEIEEKYLHYQGVLGTRKRAVTQLPITVEAAADGDRQQKDAELIRDWLNRDELEGETFDILDAIGKGISFTEMVWDTSKPVWYPRLVRRDQRWFEFDRVDGEKPRLKGGADGLGGQPTDLPPHKFIVHRHAAKTGLTVRGGLARGVAWFYLFQNMSLKDWVIFAEVYGMPIRLGKYDASATDADKRALLRAVVGIATDAAGIIPKSMEVEFVNAVSGGGPDTFERLCQFCDLAVSKATVGQTATTDAVAGGLGSGQANVHNDVREDIQRADAKTLAATLNAQVVRAIVDFNNGPPPDGRYPRVQIGKAEQFTAEDMSNIERFVKMGGRVEKSVVADKLGLPDAPADQKLDLLVAPGSGAAEKSPTEPQDPSEAPKGAGKPIAASSAILNRLKTVLKSEGGSPDAIDDLVDDLSGDWVEVIAPLIDPIETVVQEASSFEEVKERLIEAMAAMKPEKLIASLAKGQFNARLAGEAGLPTTGDRT